MKKDMSKKYAVAFVHLPTGETGRTEFVFSLMMAKQICDELDAECKTIRHFPLEVGHNIHEASRERARSNGR